MSPLIVPLTSPDVTIEIHFVVFERYLVRLKVQPRVAGREWRCEPDGCARTEMHSNSFLGGFAGVVKSLKIN